MTQKILAAHCNEDQVQVGQLIRADLDLAMANDITAPVAINEFNKAACDAVYDRHKIVLVMDHFVPNKDIRAAEQCKKVRDFARDQGIVNFFDVGEMGIEHVLLPEKGMVIPGDLVIGADSHTCTYGAVGAFATGVGSTDMAAGMATGKVWLKVPAALQIHLTGKLQPNVWGKDVILHILSLIGVQGALYQSMEFTGEGVHSLSVSDRLCIANMAVECGAKNGIFPVDDKTLEYINARTDRKPAIYRADADAVYEQVIDIDLSQVPQTVAFPHLPDNARTFDNMPDIKIDQVVIGSCTNGRLDDLAVAAAIFKGKKIARHVRCIIIPATPKIYLDAMEMGLLKIFIEAGCIVSTPTCGPCLGGYMGILAQGERCLATTNRNFVGRMGHWESEVYLASPAVAAASAIAGKIAPAE